MKKVITAVLVLVLCLAVTTGCGGRRILGTWVAETDDLLAALGDPGAFGDLPENASGLAMSWTFTAEEVTLKMGMLGEEWETTSPYTYTDGELTIDGQPVECRLSGDTMMMDLSTVANLDVRIKLKRK